MSNNRIVIDEMIQYFFITIIMKVFYKPPFRRLVKKQTRPFQLVNEDEVEKIVINPDVGKPKKVI